LQIPFEERDVDIYDAYTADECFLTSTSLCIGGVRSLNGRILALAGCQVQSPKG
jgi:branched-chain amino acid aminotransferase